MSNHHYSDNVPSVEVVRINKNANIPWRYSGTAGFDLYALEDTFLKLSETTIVQTGISFNIPSGFFGKIENINRLALIGIIASSGVIDPELYAGEVKIAFYNLSNSSNSTYKGRGYMIKKGEKIAQLIVQPISLVRLVQSEKVESSQLNENGFDSSGR